MPRQLQQADPFITGFTDVASVDEGGTGSTEVEGAVQNLGGVSRDLLGVPSGILQTDERGFIPTAILREAGFKIGYALEGPESLTPGNVSVFRITNFNSLAIPTVSVDHGSVSVVGDELLVTAPVAGDRVVLTINDREVTLPIYRDGPTPPKIVYPKAGLRIRKRSTIICRAFHSEPEAYSAWTSLDVAGGLYVPLPPLASGIELLGKRGQNGAAFIRTQEGTHQLGESITRRRIFKTNDSEFYLFKSGSGEFTYRWIYPIAEHVSTDWEVATDTAFSELVFSRYADTVNLTSCEVTLPEGVYFIRTRFNGRVAGGGTPILS
jgi:hypothetical protein